jgi:Transposase DDE domain/Transposase domain (DUF772)
MALGVAALQASFEDAAGFLGDRLAPGSVYRLLADEGHRLFPDDYFADVFTSSRLGRPTVPARVVASVMLLQAFEGLSDREACDRLAFDLRWKAAAGVTVDAEAFHPTILVGMRNRLRASGRPRRLFEDVNVVARAAGLLRGRVRVLDSTPLLDAVATQDTVTQLRAAIRKLLAAADQAGDVDLAAAVRAVLARDDAYDTVGKPACDWDDRAAREALVDALVRDADAALAACHDRSLTAQVAEAAALLAVIAGQDTEPGPDGVFRIARKVAPDRVISTVDTQARHGHKSRARRFDGYKAHLAVDPDDELITAVAVTPGNAADRDAVDELLAEDGDDASQTASGRPDTNDDDDEPPASLTVMGDSAYADGATLARLGDAGFEVVAKVPPARNTRGGFTKDRFLVDLGAGTVACPAGQAAPITSTPQGGGVARFGAACAGCPLRAACTSAKKGRVITIHPHEAVLQEARTAQQDSEWQQRYRSQRPTVERKISHFTRRPWGGRKARTRGTARVLTDVITRAGAINLARLAALGVQTTPTGWAIP